MIRAAALLEGAAALFLLGAAGAARAACGTPPAIARLWLAHHPGWRIVTLADLNPDDQALWRRYEHGACPGITIAHLDASLVPHVAIALVSTGSGPRRERFMLFHQRGVAPRQLTSMLLTNLGVLRRERPGRYEAFEGGAVQLRYDGITVEYLETSSQLFYLKAGRIESIWTSD